MLTVQPFPSSFEPPVVKRMAQELPYICAPGRPCVPNPNALGATKQPGELSTGWKFLLITGSLGLLYLSYRGCQKRGAC